MRPWNRHRLVSLALMLGLCVGWAWQARASEAPEALRRELGLWLEAVRSQDPSRICARLVKGQRIRFSTLADRDPQPGHQELDALALREQLEAGRAEELGLSPTLLLPGARELTRLADGRYQASARRCPEVRWIFELCGARFRLVEVVRVLLSC